MHTIAIGRPLSATRNRRNRKRINSFPISFGAIRISIRQAAFPAAGPGKRSYNKSYKSSIGRCHVLSRSLYFYLRQSLADRGQGDNNQCNDSLCEQIRAIVGQRVDKGCHPIIRSVGAKKYESGEEGEYKAA